MTLWAFSRLRRPRDTEGALELDRPPLGWLRPRPTPDIMSLCSRSRRSWYLPLLVHVTTAPPKVADAPNAPGKLPGRTPLPREVLAQRRVGKV